MIVGASGVKRALCLGQEFVWGAVEDHPALIEANDPIRVGASQIHLVQTDHGGDAILPAHAVQQSEDLVGRGGVETGNRLVGQDQPRSLGQRAGDPDALPLAPT